MAITRTRQTEKTVVLSGETEEVSSKKTSTKKEKSTAKAKKERFLSPKGLKEEYSKITWPTAGRIFRETIFITLFLVVVSIFIALADLGTYHAITDITKVEAAQADIIRGVVMFGVYGAVVALVFFLLSERTKKRV